MSSLSKLFNRLNINNALSSPLFLWFLSITASIIMWLYVTAMDDANFVSRKFSCPLEYRGLDTQAILRNRLSEVDVELRGPEHSILTIDYNSVHAFVDARNLTPGKRYTVNINVDVPSQIIGSVNLVSVFPSQAVLDIVRQVTRLMNVETVLPANIPAGYYIDGAQTIPHEVGIRGAEDDVAKVGSVRITPTLEELQTGHEQLMPVKFSQSEPFDGAVTLEPAQVRFRGELVRGLPRKRVPVNVKLRGILPSDYEVRSIITEPSEVQIEGNSEALEQIEAIDTDVIDVTGMTSDRVLLVPLMEPEGGKISLSKATGVKVSITLTEARAERLITNVPLEIRGTETPQKWVSIPQNVSIGIEGKPSLIASLDQTGEQISAYVDLSNIYMSPVTLPVRAEVKSADELRITRIEPSNVTINTLGDK